MWKLLRPFNIQKTLFLACFVALSSASLASAKAGPGLPTTPAWQVQCQAPGYWHLYGWRVSTAGDLNRDGFEDLLIGARVFEENYQSEGKLFVYLGSPDGPATTEDWGFASGEEMGMLGWSAAGGGDVNGDGFDDIIAGQINYQNGSVNLGAALAFYGSPGGLGASPDWLVPGLGGSSSCFGMSMDILGDVNADGYDDVVVGADSYYTGIAEGAAFVYFGSPAGLPTNPTWQASGLPYDGRFGESVAAAGDINGDGYDDLIVGAPLYETLFARYLGRAHVFLGSVDGLEDADSWTVTGDPWEFLGRSVSGAGDVNGDGYDDVLVGAPGNCTDTPGLGNVYLYYGSADGLSTNPDWSFPSPGYCECFGTDLSTAGDVNGDGYDDFLVGDVEQWFYQTSALLFYGGPNGPAAQYGWSLDGIWNAAVSDAGDVNGDQCADVAIGAPWYGEQFKGEAYLFLGRCDDDDDNDDDNNDNDTDGFAPAGETCQDPSIAPIRIPEDLPFGDDANTTCGAANNYYSTCLDVYDGGKDIVYQLTVTEETAVELSLEPKGTPNTAILLSETCPPGNPCLTSSANPLPSEHHTTCRALLPGDYWVMVDNRPFPKCIPEFSFRVTRCQLPDDDNDDDAEDSDDDEVPTDDDLNGDDSEEEDGGDGDSDVSCGEK